MRKFFPPCRTFLLSLAGWSFLLVPAQAQVQRPAVPPAGPATVLLDGKPVLEIKTGLHSFSSSDRAAAISRKLDELAKDPSFQPSLLTSTEGDSSTDLTVQGVILMSVTDQDAKKEKLGRKELAENDGRLLRQALEEYRNRYGLKSLLWGGGKTLLATLVLFLLLKLAGWIRRKAGGFVYGSQGPAVPRLGIQGLELLSAGQVSELLLGLLTVAHGAAVIFLIYVYLSSVLSFFPWTSGLAGRLFSYFWAPLGALGHSAVSYLPNLIFIAVVVLVVRYLLKVIKLIFEGVRHGRIVLEGFYPDWADPTFQILRVAILAFTAVILFPYLPGSDSIAFKGISVFLGLLLSLGSGSAMANAISGVILTYMRPFQVGDRVKINETVGDVEEKTLLVTRIHTIKHEIVTIPNSMVLGSHLINYSSSARGSGLILHTSVTLGYDIPWRKAEELLVAAAEVTEDILKEPRPFVLQTALGDFNVTYELNATTDKPARMAVLYSDLHRNIQDQFNRAGVEIMSPHYSALRDGNSITIPPESRPKDYRPGGFRFSPPPTGASNKEEN